MNINRIFINRDIWIIEQTITQSISTLSYKWIIPLDMQIFDLSLYSRVYHNVPHLARTAKCAQWIVYYHGNTFGVIFSFEVL